MTGSRRWLAATLLALCCLPPAAPGPEGGRPFAARAIVGRWLVGAGSPLDPWRDARGMPPLAVDVLQSPPLVDDAARAAAAADYARCAADRAEALGLPLSTQRAPLPIEVRIGERGVRATAPQPEGPPAVLERALPTRWSRLPWLLVALAALGGLSAGLALAAGAIAAAAVAAIPLAGRGPGLGEAFARALHALGVEGLGERVLTSPGALAGIACGTAAAVWLARRRPTPGPVWPVPVRLGLALLWLAQLDDLGAGLPLAAASGSLPWSIAVPALATAAVAGFAASGNAPLGALLGIAPALGAAAAVGHPTAIAGVVLPVAALLLDRAALWRAAMLTALACAPLVLGGRSADLAAFAGVLLPFVPSPRSPSAAVTGPGHGATAAASRAAP